jgi:predicted nuclease of predicted toxin-antitoxin system
VRPLDFPLLADENIAADVVASLRVRGSDVRSVDEEGLIGHGDGELLQCATALHRVIVTHDLAFGKVEIRGASFVGIIYLRPGHISVAFILDRLFQHREPGCSQRLDSLRTATPSIDHATGAAH